MTQGSRTPEELAAGLNDVLSHFLLFLFKGFLRDLDLFARDRTFIDRAEWELRVFLVYCAAQACVAGIPDETRRNAVLASFFTKFAGPENADQILSMLQPKVEEYELKLLSRDPAAAAMAAANLLYSKILPGEPVDPERIKVLRGFYVKMATSFRTVVGSG